MTNKRNPINWFWLVSSLGAALLLGMMSSVALAASTTLSNGAELSVTLDNPSTCDEFIVPAADPDGLIDVNVDGTASVGLGEPDATIIYVIDESGSTGSGSGTGCSPILNCEKNFFNALNAAAIADGSTDLAGVVHYAGSSNIQQSLVAPTNPAIPAAINAASAGGSTNCAAGLNNATTLVNSGANDNGTSLVVFASDGFCNTGGSVATAANTLGATGAIVHSVAIGTGSNCTTNGGTGTLGQIPQNGGTCTPVADPGNLPDIIENLIGSFLDSLDIEVDGGGKTQIPASQVDPAVPPSLPGAVSVTYGIVNSTTVTGLDPADHDICVSANGSDVLGDSQTVTECSNIHLLQLTASPPSEDNNLNFDDEHTVTAAIIGGTGPDRNIDFVVGGTNAAAATPPNASINATPGGASVDFVYTVPKDCASLGTDTITVSTTIAGVLDSIDVTKEWFDDVPPNVSCDPTTNPHGNQEPSAPGQGGQGQNQDGFYQLNAEDPNLANCTVTLEVADGDGYVFPGPFLPGDKIKYTQADGAPQSQKKMGSSNGQAGAIRWHLKGHGDLSVTGTDPSGNSATATCLVPPPPK